MTSEALGIDALAARIDELEHRSRALGRVATGASCLCAFLLLVQILGAIRPPPPVIDADAFVLRDVDGVERARLALDDEGVPGLVLSDRIGHRRARLGLAADGMPAFTLRDGAGRVRAGWALLPDGRPQLALLGPEGPPRVALTTSEPKEAGGEAGRLLLRDGAGATVYEAP